MPAIEAAREKGINACGPYPPDSVFVRARAGEFDMVVAMYHDQGHIPLKMAGFWMDEQGKMQQVSGINYTAGLPITVPRWTMALHLTRPAARRQRAEHGRSHPDGGFNGPKPIKYTEKTAKGDFYAAGTGR